MEWLTPIVEALRARAATWSAVAAQRVPDFLEAVLLLLVGWLVARLARGVIRALGGRINRGLDRILRSESTSRLRVSPTLLRVLGTAAFWIILMVFATAAARTAGFDEVAEWLKGVLRYLPTLAFGVGIIVVGHLLGLLVRDLLVEALATAQVEQRELVARLAQTATFLTAIVVGVHQVGVDLSFVTLIVAVVLASVLVGFSIAFGLGARSLVANLIGTHYLRRHFQPGMRVRVGEVEGEILEITPTNVVLESDEGRAHVPSHLFAHEVTLIVPAESDDE